MREVNESSWHGPVSTYADLLELAGDHEHNGRQRCVIHNTFEPLKGWYANPEVAVPSGPLRRRS